MKNLEKTISDLTGDDCCFDPKTKMRVNDMIKDGKYLKYKISEDLIEVFYTYGSFHKKINLKKNKKKITDESTGKSITKVYLDLINTKNKCSIEGLESFVSINQKTCDDLFNWDEMNIMKFNWLRDEILRINSQGDEINRIKWMKEKYKKYIEELKNLIEKKLKETEPLAEIVPSSLPKPDLDFYENKRGKGVNYQANFWIWDEVDN